MRTLGVNRNELMYFDMLFNATALEAKPNSPELPLISSLEWIKTVAVPVTKKLTEKMEFNAY